MKKTKSAIHFKFTTRLLIGIGLLTLVPVITVSFFTYFFTAQLMMDAVKKQTKSDLSNSVNHVDRLIHTYWSSLQTLSEDESFIKLLAEEPDTQEASSMIFEKLYLIMGDRRGEVSMFVVSADNSLRISTVATPTQYDPVRYHDWGIFRKIQENGQSPVVFPNIYDNALGQRNILTIATGIMQEGEILGYVILDIPESVLKNMLGTSNGYNAYRYVIVSENGLLLYNNVVTGATHNFIYPELRELLQNQSDTVYTIGSSDFCVAKEVSTTSPIEFLALQNLDYLDNMNSYVHQVIFLVVISSAILSVIAGYFFGHSLTKPIKQIIGTIEEIEKGNLGLRINLNRSDEFGFVADRFDETLQSLNLYYQWDLERQDRLRLAELQSLQAQINPHFLYNTLDSIKWLAKLNHVPEISTIVTDLGRLLKSSMSTDTTETTLKESIRLIESYIDIQLIRYEHRFDYRIDLDEQIEEYRIPKLLLQPLVENAIIHGMEQCLHKVFIEVTAYLDGEHVIITVKDDGVGMKVPWEDLNGEEIALKNIDRRIKLFYGAEYGLQIESEQGKGTVALLKLPKEVPSKEDNLWRK